MNSATVPASASTPRNSGSASGSLVPSVTCSEIKRRAALATRPSHELTQRKTFDQMAEIQLTEDEISEVMMCVAETDMHRPGLIFILAVPSLATGILESMAAPSTNAPTVLPAIT